MVNSTSGRPSPLAASDPSGLPGSISTSGTILWTVIEPSASASMLPKSRSVSAEATTASPTVDPAMSASAAPTRGNTRDLFIVVVINLFLPSRPQQWGLSIKSHVVVSLATGLACARAALQHHGCPCSSWKELTEQQHALL